MLRYGENPHQQGAFYRELHSTEPSVSRGKILHGKAMSYNNFLDANSALELAKEYDEIAVAIIKHNNPCGVALGATPVEAYVKARETDPISAFGGVIAFNRPVDLAAAKEITSTFVEVVIAPGFADDALAELKRKKDLRLLDVGPLTKVKQEGFDLKKLVGGLIVQDRDLGVLTDLKALNVPTSAQTDGRGICGLRLCVEGLQACEVERDYLCEAGADRGDRGRPDEPGRFGEACGDESPNADQGVRDGVGRVLSIPRWFGCCRAGGDHGGHSAGRFDSRYRNHQSRR